MANPLLQLPWETCLLEPVQDSALARRLRREAGDAPAWSRHFWTSPWFAKAAIRLGFTNGLLRDLDFDLAILIALVVSQENSCRYCYATMRAMMRMLGVEEARVSAIESDLATHGLAPRTAAAVKFARAVNRGHLLDGSAERAHLVAAGFSHGEIREIAYVTTFVGLMNRMSTIVALPPAGWEQLPDRWFVRLLQPLLPGLLKRMLKRGGPGAPEAPDSPLPAVVRTAFADSPIGIVLADSMRDLWQSSGLPQRTKLLMFATIAQGLDCAVCRQELDRLAVSRGIDAPGLTRAAAHLDDPTLDADERRYCAFARESLWYEPQFIQRRARALCEAVGPAALVEAIAVVTLGNMLMRLQAALADA